MSKDRVIGDPMLFAVDALIEKRPGSTPEQKTQDFWNALTKFGPEYLTGKFNMVVNEDTGSIVITYKPE